MGRKKDHFPLFLFPQISYLEWEKTEKPFFFSSFFFLFVSFLPFFLSFFLFRSRKWGRKGVRMDSDLFPFKFLFMEKRERINWKNLKEILSIFLLKFLSSFLFFSLLLFSFWEGEWRGKGERWEDRKDYPKHANQLLQEHSTFWKSIFGEKNTPKIHILCQKYA